MTGAVKLGVGVEVERASGLVPQALGLMFRRGFPENRFLLFDMGRRGVWRVHTWFVPFEIDVAGVSEDGECLGAVQVRPFSFTEVAGRYILECRAGLAAEAGLSPGRWVEW